MVVGHEGFYVLMHDAVAAQHDDKKAEQVVEGPPVDGRRVHGSDRTFWGQLFDEGGTVGYVAISLE